MSNLRHLMQRRLVGLLVLSMAIVAFPLAGQNTSPAPAESDSAEPAQPVDANDDSTAEEELPSVFYTTTVTATLSKVDAFKIPQSVSVIEEIEERPVNNAAELIVEEPGVEVNGVGANQVRPIIRGQRGLRVLFLEDGLSVNNPRRQTDFGEITGVVDLDQVETIEVVRGPASVLYGSGAIGGVLNLITKAPPLGAGSGLRGGLALRASTADDQEKAAVDVGGHSGSFSYQLQASRRDSGNYEAPAGTFGAVRLERDTEVIDTGVEDHTFRGQFAFDLSDQHQLRLSGSQYRADQFGFGFIDPALVDPEFDGTQTRILYPFQDFDRYTLGYSAAGLGAVADTLDARAYSQSNERELVFDADINIGPIFPGAPSSGITIDTLNFTDLDTLGLRVEAGKDVGRKQHLTWGLDVVEDTLDNTDRADQVLTFRFPFPPSVMGLIPGFTCVDFTPPFECSFAETDNVANTPNAENTTFGVFLQDEIFAHDRFKAIAGVRYQNVETKARETPGLDTSGLDFSDSSVVGALNLLYSVNDSFELVGSVGSAFRAPSIIERLFNGLTPEGLGFQLLNPDLESETSDYFDVGFKFRKSNGYLNAVYFENQIDNGIIQDFLSPAEVAALPADLQSTIERSGVQFVVQQRNVDKTIIEGFELDGGYRFTFGLSVGFNYTHLDGRRVDSDNPPTGDVAGDSYNLSLRWDRSRYSIEYHLRHNDEEPAVIEPGDPVPLVGETLPAFTVHSLNAFATVHESSLLEHQVGLMIANLTNELYAEFSNIGSFRPQPKRNFILSYRLRVR